MSTPSCRRPFSSHGIWRRPNGELTTWPGSGASNTKAGGGGGGGSGAVTGATAGAGAGLSRSAFIAPMAVTALSAPHTTIAPPTAANAASE
jgi:hypothetical protein